MPPGAIFLPAPTAGSLFPRSQRGDWLNCWFDQEHELNRCRLSKLDGSLEYEGLFLPYEASGTVPKRNSRSDVATAGARVQWQHFGEHFLPTIYLRDETTLLPAEAYGEDPLHEDE